MNTTIRPATSGLLVTELTPGPVTASLARLSAANAAHHCEQRIRSLTIEAARTFDATHAERCRVAAAEARAELEALTVLRGMLRACR